MRSGVLLLILAGACGREAAQTEDAGPTDQASGEGVRPPDIHSGDGGGTGNIGQFCNPQDGTKGCQGKATCLTLSSSVGICAVPGCTLEEVSTPEIEDTCPLIPTPGSSSPTRTICTRIQDLGTTYCLPACTPSTQGNPCTKFHALLACDPVSLLYNDHSAVCLFPRCVKDSDCGNKSSINPDATCHTPTGVCMTKGSPNAKIGDPCKSDKDCGNWQNCYPQRKTSTGKTVVEGGYCTVVGCHLGAPWACPAGSKCFSMGPLNTLSLCLATGCQATKPNNLDGCRDEATANQYDCIYLDKTEVCWLDPKAGK